MIIMIHQNVISEETTTYVHQNIYRVLVLDDDPAICKMLEKLLKKIDCEVECVYHGEGAISKYLEYYNTDNPFNFVIIDLVIPGYMSGFEAFQKMKEINPDIKGIISSGYFENPIMADYKNYGFSARLPKPYSFAQLLAVVKHIQQAA